VVFEIGLINSFSSKIIYTVEEKIVSITIKRGEKAPRLAARTEKRANKNVKIRLLFS